MQQIKLWSLITFLLFILNCTSTTSVSHNSTLESERNLETALMDLTKQIAISVPEGQKKKIAVIPLSNLDGTTTKLGQYLAEELTTRLCQTQRFKVIERQQLDKVISEQELGMTALIDPHTAASVCRILGADAIVSGSITEFSSSVKINARIIAAETGEIYGVAATEIFKDAEVRKLAGQKSAGQSFHKSASLDNNVEEIKKRDESYVEVGEDQNAIEEHKTIIKSIPEHVSSRIQIGNDYLKMGQYNTAEKCYKEALEIEPTNLSIYYQLINLEFTRKNLSGAKRYINKGFSIDSNDGILNALYGEYYYRLGLRDMQNKEWNPAIEKFEESIRIWQRTETKTNDPKWIKFLQKGIRSAEKNIEEIRKVMW